MRTILQPMTDWVSTKKGMWITIAVWLIVMVLLSAGPKVNDYKVSNFEFLPDDAASIIAAEKLEQYFPNDQGVPGILVFHNEKGAVNVEEAKQVVTAIINAEVEGVDNVVNIAALPPQVTAAFTSEDQSTLIVPMALDKELGSREIGETIDLVSEVTSDVVQNLQETSFYITGPAGIASDTLKLFEKADFNLLIATIAIILVLLIVIYRSPLLALIPLLATAIVYQVVNQIVGLMAAGGLQIHNATMSIMSILLFAAVIDYSLFVFSRYREELNHYESKFEAMQKGMRATGVPVFLAGGTVFVAMLILFVADFRDYQNFAPVFSTAVLIIMLASITLVPALFALFGRKSFWPKVPKFGDQKEIKHSFWGPVAKFVVNKPVIAGGLVAVILIVSALNVFNLKFEFDQVKSFPTDLPSRVGYEIVEARYDKGSLAQTSILFESDQAMDGEDVEGLRSELEKQEGVASVTLSNQSEDATKIQYSLTLDLNPYSVEAIDVIQSMRSDSELILEQANQSGVLHFAGTTAKLLDEREIVSQDIWKIVILETLFILVLLYILTRSFKMPIYMMATILLSYLSALGLGIFLVDVLFGYYAVSTRVPVYGFIFLVALGIDYNIIMVSRFLEERKGRPLKEALEIALRNTGGVISSAGLILAATFAALTTMPIADLFVFGFIVAIGILLDTFLVRGMLLPSLILWFEKDKA